jgi:hypothetical protein
MGQDTSLDELAIRYGADKSSKVHYYTRAYDWHFGPLRNAPISLLEIGAGAGSSLRMWRDYFARAKIYGLDVQECKPVETLGMTVFVGSQADDQVLENVAAKTGPLDVIIDDGSHRWSDQIGSFKTLYPHIKPGGYYVIEDLHTSYWDKYKSGAERTVRYLLELVHELNLNGKSGYGRMENDPDYQEFQGKLTLFQKTVDSIAFYKSIVFIKKKEPQMNADERR